jgi:membrane protease YdiL (CAAX protease family)
MIQRIQTLYLFIVILLTAVLPFVVNVWPVANDASLFSTDELLYIAIVLGIIAFLALVSILTYKTRKKQFVFNRLNMILNFFLLGFFVYRLLTLSGEINISEKGIGVYIPIFSIVLLVLANKAIKKDEDLVKSVDRLR